jgi:ribonucleoside-diphosphate reductase subunit M1
MLVKKRNNKTEPIYFDKITQRIRKLINNNEIKYLDPILIAKKVIEKIYSEITTEELDIISADICVNLSTTHPSYANLGGKILVSNLHKKTTNNFVSKIQLLETNNIINKDFLNYVIKNEEKLNSIIDYNNDYIYDYFGFKTLEKSYLLKINNNIIERPQDMLLRVAITLQYGNLDLIEETYKNMSLGYYIHASPTLFNAGTNNQQLSSCFLLGIEDSLTDITKTWNSCAQISKGAGGIGIHVNNIRSKHSKIKGTGGLSNGLVPFLQIFNYIARWVDQGGRRPGSIAVYIEPYHPDIFDFLDLRKNFGAETERARDLFQSLWIPDLFMKLIQEDQDWYLMSADECPGLSDVYGDEFETLYWKYVNEKKYRKVVKARKLWMTILETQIETGIPYIGFKDHINKKCNQKNLGTIKSSNLCHEITEFSNSDEYAVCNLASLGLKTFIIPFENNINNEWIIYTKDKCKYCTYTKNYLNNNNIIYTEINYTNETNIELKTLLNKTNITYPQIFIKNNDILNNIGGWDNFYKYTSCTFDYNKLYDIAYLATINLDKVIDINYYPIPQAKYSNIKNRPIGLGIQGLADVLVLLRIPFDSEESVEFNKKIMEVIYLASITASNDIAKNRYEKIKQLIIFIKINFKENDIPEYYDKSYILSNIYYNDLYHELKFNKCELLNTDKTFIGGYSTFENSPFSEGKFQFDLWDVNPTNEKWNILRQDVIKYGTRNSLLTALMPTASTSQILGNNECFEFFTNNIYTRKTHAGDFIIVNKYLIKDLLSINMWSHEIKDKIINNNGSIQQIDEIPSELKILYKTIWEIKQIWVLKNALARSPYVDQAQSMNIFMAKPDFQRLHSSHFKAWELGLKTGMYYLRTRPSVNAIKFTIDPNLENINNDSCEKSCESCSG